MADLVRDKYEEQYGEKPELTFEEPPGEEPEFEVVDPDAPKPDVVAVEDPEKAELKGKLEKMEAQLVESARRGDEVTALKEGIAALGTRLGQPAQAQYAPPPMESEEQFAEKYKTDYMEDPYGYADKLFKRKMAPLVNQLVGNQMKLARRAARGELGDTFSKYEGEIDRQVKEMDQSDPDVYFKAHDLVLARHMDDVKLSMKESLRAELLEELKKELPTPSGRPSPQAQYSPGAPPAAGKRIRITPAEEADARRQAEVLGVAPEKYIASKFADRRK